jgi:hypothetical protein
MPLALRLVLFSLIALWLGACENSPHQTRADIDLPAAKDAHTTVSAETVLKKFIEASIKRQHTEFYDLLSNKDQATKTKEAYLQEQLKLQPNLADAYFQEITFEISSIKHNANEARAEVNYQYPDVERMIKKVYNLSILDPSALPALDEMKLQIDMAFKDNPLPKKTITRHFNLIRENNNWAVYLGWDKQK